MPGGKAKGLQPACYAQHRLATTLQYIMTSATPITRRHPAVTPPSPPVTRTHPQLQCLQVLQRRQRGVAGHHVVQPQLTQRVHL